jgi:hypothetical protein
MARSALFASFSWVAAVVVIAAMQVAALSKPPTYVVQVEDGQLDQVRVVVSLTDRDESASSTPKLCQIVWIHFFLDNDKRPARVSALKKLAENKLGR